MATTQLLDGSIRICKVLTPNPRTEWQLEVTSNAGVSVVLGVDFPLREFFKEVLDLYPDDMPAPAVRLWSEFDDDNCEEDLGDEEHPGDCDCVDCEGP
jgi:hypothetical protein